MNTQIDPISLTQQLIAFDTISPAGNEQAPAEYLAGMLEHAGFAVRLVPFGDGRANLVARIGPGDAPVLCFTGHLDTVPLGSQPWSVDPHRSVIKNGRLYGRGSSDMKSGVAAFVSAAVEAARSVSASRAAVSLVITAGEETGCEGALDLARSHPETLGKADALVIAEPTGNRPLLGHKGVLWLRAITAGVTAHGSMPHLGDNALYKAARIIDRLSRFRMSSGIHPVMGETTLNVGTCHGGININSVPDRAAIEIDLRTPPDMDHDQLATRIRTESGADLDRLDVILDLDGIWTDPRTEWVGHVFETVRNITGEEPSVAAASYFTDGSALVPALGSPPAVVLGPGEPSMAHQTDEYCEISKLIAASAIYQKMIQSWAACS